MAKTSLTGLTPGDANPKKKANQKRTKLAKGNSTGDVSQVNLQFEQPKIQQFKWYGDTYSRPTEANLVPTLDLPSVQGYYEDTRIAKQNEFTAFINSMKTLKGEVEQLDDNYTKFRVEEQKYLTNQASQILDTYSLGNDGTEINPANKLNSIEKQLMKIIAKRDDTTGTLNESDLEDIRLAEKTLKEIRKNKRLQNTILSQVEERKVYDNIATWNNKKNSLKVDYLDKDGNKVQLIENGEPQFESDGVTPIYEQITVGELSPDDDRYKNAYNQHVFGNAKLGVFEHNNVNGYVTQHRTNDRTSQESTYQNILNKQETIEITGDINTLRKSIKNDSTFTDAKLSENLGTIVERINKANHLPDETKKQLVKDLIAAVAEEKNLSGLDTLEYLKDLFYGTDDSTDGVNGIGTGTSNSRYKEVDGGYVLTSFFIDSFGGERFLRNIVTSVIRERNDFETADKFLRDVQAQENLMDEVENIKIEDESAKDILANYNVNGTENQIKADTKVIQAKKAILSKIDANFEKEIEKLNQQKDNKTITQSEFATRIEELEKSRETLLKNIVYDLTPTEFRADVKLLKKDANACLLAGENSSACTKYLSSYKALVGIYGQEVVDLQTGIATTHKNIVDMEGSIVATAINQSLKTQEDEFKNAYKSAKPTASDTEINAAWEQVKPGVEKYLIDTYFEMTSDGQKINNTKLNDRVRDDKENGSFKEFFNNEGIDPLVTGNKYTTKWYGGEEPGTSYVGDSPGNYGNIVNNRLDDVNFDANDLYRAGTEEYSFVLHIDSPNGVVFNPKAGTQFYFNILFSGREGQTVGGVFYSPHQIYSNQLNKKEFAPGAEKTHKRTMSSKSRAAYKNLENLFKLLEATNKYGSGDGVDLGNFIIFETENSIKNLYPEAVTDGVIDYNHSSIPANLKDFPQHKEFLLKLNGVETFQDARGMILKYNENLGL